MAYQRLPASSALNWLVRGWTYFMRAPLPWLMLAALYILIGLLLSIVPVVGPLLTALLWPALAGGLYQAARMVDEGGTPGPGVLLTALRDPTLRGPILVLGVPPVVAFVLGALGFVLVLGGATGAGLATGSDQVAVGTLLGGSLLLPLLAVLLTVAVVVALLYAIPLVMFDGAGPMAAMEQSVLASVANALPLALLSLLYLVAAAFAAIPMGLGFLVLIPVITGAVYASYVDIWGSPAD